MEDKIMLSVATAEQTVFEHKVNYVNLPTGFGSLGVIKGHAPMLCAVSSGTIKCRFGENTVVRIKIDEGVANIGNNEVTVLVKHGEVLE